MAKKPFPPPKRFSVALSEKAYARLRQLNETHGLGNNYLLTVLLENLDEFSRPGRLDGVLLAFIKEYGAPKIR